ncbi:uncharacterized protein LOC131544658 isoform X2 [Onychostoma macrolepis]|uniref:uncharacterized protein LOC131544658 isoform X2 n=1 Tax=Onychostoma macrolepis TaxID=369639 RepID=UPI00272A7EA8|nr:uncharacterized protein LOC131544658 isoform X2 [Onychostoma macrolepis]
MDAAILLLALKQGTRSLEGYITEYLALANGSELPDYMLIDFFCEGINQPLKSRLTLEAPRSSLSDFIDYALVTVGSAFTVGVAEECDTAFNCMITDALEHAHKMAAATTPRHVTATIHEPSQVALDLQESSQVTADLHELNQVTVDVKESNQVTVAVKEPSEVTVDVRESSQATVDRHELSQATVDRHELSQSTTDRHEPRQVTIDLHESSQDTADLHESSQDKADFHELSQVTASLRESSQVAADLHESSQVKADLHESSQVKADLQEPSQVAVDVRESSQVTVGRHQPSHVSADHPESLHVSADLLKSSHVTAVRPESQHHVPADLPESGHVRADTPRSSRSQALLWVPDPPWWAPALSVTNPVCALPFIHHQRSLTHHIDFHTTHHNGLRFPSAISPITCSPDHTHTAVTNHTLYLNPVLSLPRRRVLYALSLPYRAPLVFLALPSLALPLSDCVFPCLDYRSRCWITSPVLPLWILFADRRPTLVFVYSLSRPCYTCLPLFDPAC